MRHLPAVLGAFALGCLAGLLAGRTIGERSGQMPQKIAQTQGAGHPEAPSALKSSPSKNDAGAAEISRLHKQVQDLEARLEGATNKEDKFQFAREVFEGLTKQVVGSEDADRGLKFSMLAGDLKPEMAPYFIDKLNDPAHKKHRDKILKLILACAGPVATGVLKEFLCSPIRTIEENNAVTEALLGGGYGHRQEPVIPMDVELRALGEQKIGSLDSRERELGIGVLAQDPTDTTRGRLQSLAQSDSNEQVRISAIRALAVVGDRTTIVFFEGLIGSVPQPWPLEKPIVTEEDRKKAYVAEAYDHIQERLHK
jgi:hypothetical protein